jgi:hypothetical protein
VGGGAEEPGTDLEADSLLSGTFDLFPLAEVLGLIERAAANGVLVVRGREVEGCLYFVEGALCAGEIGDVSGPVEGRQALEVRLLEVAVPLLRARGAEFEFRADVTPPWPAPVAVAVDVVFEPARRIAREWSSIMTAIESFESVLERTGSITTDSITLGHLGFRLLEAVDGQASIRELARRTGVSLVAVAPEIRTLVLVGAVRVTADAERALATAQADVEQEHAPPERALDVTTDDPVPDVAPVPVAAGPVDADAPVDTDALARERAELAARAGLDRPGPGEPAPAPEAPPAERAQIVVDRSELLRMFSGLKDE